MFTGEAWKWCRSLLPMFLWTELSHMAHQRDFGKCIQLCAWEEGGHHFLEQLACCHVCGVYSPLLDVEMVNEL